MWDGETRKWKQKLRLQKCPSYPLVRCYVPQEIAFERRCVTPSSPLFTHRRLSLLTCIQSLEGPGAPACPSSFATPSFHTDACLALIRSCHGRFDRRFPSLLVGSSELPGGPFTAVLGVRRQQHQQPASSRRPCSRWPWPEILLWHLPRWGVREQVKRLKIFFFLLSYPLKNRQRVFFLPDVLCYRIYRGKYKRGLNFKSCFV